MKDPQTSADCKGKWSLSHYWCSYCHLTCWPHLVFSNAFTGCAIFCL